MALRYSTSTRCGSSAIPRLGQHDPDVRELPVRQHERVAERLPAEHLDVGNRPGDNPVR